MVKIGRKKWLKIKEKEENKRGTYSQFYSLTNP